MKVTIKTTFNPSTGRVLWLVQTPEQTAHEPELLQALESCTDIPHQAKLRMFFEVRENFTGSEAIYQIFPKKQKEVVS